MAVSPYTNDFMRALPAPFRPNPFNIDEYVMQAIENGWDTDSLAKACYINERKPQPAFTVTNLKTLCLHGPATSTIRRGWDYGHLPCNNHFHVSECEICRCEPSKEVHHVSVRVPNELKGVLGLIGRMPSND